MPNDGTCNPPTTPIAVHGKMAKVIAANRSLRTALVARRHIDLKRVCSSCCRP